MSEFHDKLAQKASGIVVLVNPNGFFLPAPIWRHDDPLLPYTKAIVQATGDLVAAYLFDMSSFLGLGGAGAMALERSIRYVANTHPTILHGPFVGQQHVQMADKTGFGPDAITLAHKDDVAFYLQNPPYAALLMGDVLPEEGSSGCYDALGAKLSVKFADETRHYRVTAQGLLASARGLDFADVIRAQVQAMLA